MTTLVLRNDRLDSGTWFVTSAVFAVVGLACFCGLVVANVRDPKALWMGPAVSSPQVIYLVFDGFLLLISALMAWAALFKSKKFFDRSVQLTFDEAGIHDHRDGRDIAWSQVVRISGRSLYSGAIATMARLEIAIKDGTTVGIDILGLDRDHKAILDAAEAMAAEKLGRSRDR
jgi:hypothetical protein